MITRRATLLAAGGAALVAAAPARAQNAATGAAAMKITRSGTIASRKGAPQNFTGAARVDTPFQATAPARVSGGFVTFEPGARTAWHTHPLGQTLVVMAGHGWVQSEGAPKEQIRPGDVVWIPPGVKHWHGATASMGMTHLAISEALDGKTVDWLDQVSQQDYEN
jgi:quercetin dioxygenase-like cupin family protein